MEKVGNTQGEMGNLSRETNTIRKNPKEILEIINTEKEKDTCDWIQPRK